MKTAAEADLFAATIEPRIRETARATEGTALDRATTAETAGTQAAAAAAAAVAMVVTMRSTAGSTANTFLMMGT
jgi:hypothetical protein